jgi:hypothetical protein
MSTSILFLWGVHHALKELDESGIHGTHFTTQVAAMNGPSTSITLMGEDPKIAKRPRLTQNISSELLYKRSNSGTKKEVIVVLSVCKATVLRSVVRIEVFRQCFKKH